MMAKVRQQLGEQAFAAAWAEGQAMTPEQVLALEEHSTSFGLHEQSHENAEKNTRKQTGPQGLTRREVDVLRLVAQGYTDAQIAEALVISPRTVHAHLRSIYSKLGVSSRFAAIHYAVEAHLI